MSVYDYNLWNLDLDEKPGDSNEVCAAKGLLRAFRARDGISDEMSYADIDLLNDLSGAATCAIEILRARDLL